MSDTPEFRPEAFTRFDSETYQNPGWSGGRELGCGEDWTVAKLSSELDDELERYPVVHAWRTDSGSGLTFWCRYCKVHHTHGRHGGPEQVETEKRWDAEANRVPHIDTVLSEKLWQEYLSQMAACKFNPNVPGGRGTCTCPMGSGDGHRAADCHNRGSGWYEHGYVLHEVAPDDTRATRKPKRV